jgi:haloacetate dehalogenase
MTTFRIQERAMAKELVDVMVKLGFPTFTLIGHDRGERVSYRLAWTIRRTSSVSRYST